MSAPVPEKPTLKSLREAVQTCRACELFKGTTQAVFGEGAAKAEVMFVGEQPGDREDREGHPFVGPAGRVLDNALEAAGINRKLVYVTNAVKHFHYEERGKRRIHQRPRAEHMRACHPWLEAELAVVRPRVLVCLGAVAAQALLGSKVKVAKDRGRPLESPALAPVVIVTVHPSSILRAREAAEREAAMQAFVSDLQVVAKHVASLD